MPIQPQPMLPLYKKSKLQQMQAVMQTGSQQTLQDAMDVAAQGKYTPEKQMVRELMRLLFQGLDCALISMGRDAVFTTPDRADSDNETLAGHEPGANRRSVFMQ